MIAKDSEKIQVILKKKDGDLLRKLAEREDRSLSNMAAILLKKSLKNFK